MVILSDVGEFKGWRCKGRAPRFEYRERSSATPAMPEYSGKQHVADGPASLLPRLIIRP
jgi:hypothetical protein